MKFINVFAVICLTLLVTACGSATKTREPTIPPPQTELNRLAQNLSAADQQLFNLYAPDTYKDVRKLYQSATRHLTSNPAKAKEIVDKGLRLAGQLEETGNRVKQQLAGVDSARNDALQAGAAKLLASDLAELDEKLVDLASVAERKSDFTPGETTKELIDNYKATELRSLKLSILGEADDLLNIANDKRLRDFAPKTMRLAEEEYLLGTSILNADRNQTDKAAGHAANVIRHVEHAQILTEQIKQVNNGESTLEDVLLWHENQLAEAVKPLKAQLPQGKGFAATTSALATEIRLLQAENQSLMTSINEAKSRESDLKLQKEQDLNILREDLEQQMLAVQLESDAEQRRVAKLSERFKFVQDLFNSEEAEVYQQGQNILIRAHGFTFDPGSSEISEKNIPLINKILDAAEGFPSANIEVSGHTDSLGNSENNQSLSEARAKAVADFLTSAGQIPADKITSVGYGSRQPVAPNDADAGRAANRRVEILIKNTDS